jgi:hypothetical protein
VQRTAVGVGHIQIAPGSAMPVEKGLHGPIEFREAILISAVSERAGEENPDRADGDDADWLHGMRSSFGLSQIIFEL